MRKQFKTLLFVLVLAIASMPCFSQIKTSVKTQPESVQLAEFKRINTKADVSFTPPAGFREIIALNNEDFTFDYAMELPRRGFEVWYLVRSQKENWQSYERASLTKKAQLSNPDSVYADLGKAQAAALTDGNHMSFVRILPSNILKRYNADAGRSFLLNLADMPATKHYRYALLISLQKYHTGTVLMLCFTNSKGPEFYKNVEIAGRSIKFKPDAQNVDKLTD